ncbi:MAG: IS4 family transposase, partial [Verrucomicrobiaceae bacterium]
EATRARVRAAPGTVLILHDTTHFVFQRESAGGFGLIGAACLDTGSRPGRRRRDITVRGLLMHSSMALTPDGVPLGLAAAKFWSRQQFKGANALRRQVNPTRIPIEEKESHRWLENLRESGRLLGNPERQVHIGDRESDIYELFRTAQSEHTHFLVRTCVDRLADEEGHTVAKAMEKPDGSGSHVLFFDAGSGRVEEARLDVRWRRLRILPPVGKQARWPGLELTVIHAMERGAPAGCEPIDWKLLTSLPVSSLEEAVEKMDWYALRWKIETFHKILKSGCRAEDSQLRTSERVVKLIALYCVVSWRVFWMTMLNRANPRAEPSLVLTQEEQAVLDAAVPPKSGHPPYSTLGDYLKALARLGGWLARAGDSPPGNMVIWRGWRRLGDMVLGFKIAKIYG